MSRTIAQHVQFPTLYISSLPENRNRDGKVSFQTRNDALSDYNLKIRSGAVKGGKNTWPFANFQFKT